MKFCVGIVDVSGVCCMFVGLSDFVFSVGFKDVEATVNVVLRSTVFETLKLVNLFRCGVVFLLCDVCVLLLLEILFIIFIVFLLLLFLGMLVGG